MKTKRRKKLLARAPDFDRSGTAIPADLFPAGRVRFSLKTTDPDEVAVRRAELGKLWTWRAWDVLAGLVLGTLDPGNVAAAVARDGRAAVEEFRVRSRAAADAEAARARAAAIPTVRERVVSYLAWYGRGRREEESVKQVTSRLLGAREGRGFCRQLLTLPGILEPVEVGTLPFPDLTGQQLEAVLLAGWTNDSTREAIRGAVSGLYTWAIEEERGLAKREGRAPRWDENPAGAVEQYERRARVVTASEGQARALLAHAESYQAAYLRAFLHLGLREGELIHTRAHLDLDLGTWLWTIQGRGPDARHGCVQCWGKGWTPKSRRHSWRTLLVPERPAELRGAILRYLDLSPATPGDFLFRNPRTGRVWEARALATDFLRLCERAGVLYGRKVPGGITLHDLRATCATRLVQAKERESVIAKLLGDSVQTIVTSYVRLDSRDLAECVSNGPSYRLEEVR